MVGNFSFFIPVNLKNYLFVPVTLFVEYQL